MPRTLYLVAYDISDPRRLGRVCRSLKGYRVQGQKSVPEIWVTPAALDPRMKPRCMGQARTFSASHFCIT